MLLQSDISIILLKLVIRHCNLAQLSIQSIIKVDKRLISGIATDKNLINLFVPKWISKIHCTFHREKPIYLNKRLKNITFLSLYIPFNTNLNILPWQVSELILSDGFATEIPENSLPISITSIRFGKGYNHVLKPNTLPPNLVSVTFNDQNRKMIKGTLPISIQIVNIFNNSLQHLGNFDDYLINLHTLRFITRQGLCVGPFWYCKCNLPIKLKTFITSGCVFINSFPKKLEKKNINIDVRIINQIESFVKRIRHKRMFRIKICEPFGSKEKSRFIGREYLPIKTLRKPVPDRIRELNITLDRDYSYYIPILEKLLAKCRHVRKITVTL